MEERSKEWIERGREEQRMDRRRKRGRERSGREEHRMDRKRKRAEWKRGAKHG